MPYIGNQPGTGVRSRFVYTATASQTTFTGADDNGKTLKYADSDYVDVYLNGVCLVPVVDYTATSKTSVVLIQAASLNDTLEVVAYDIATISDTVSKADGGTFEGDLGITSASPDLTFTNSTSEDTDGGRESTITFKGKQSGGEESTLAQIQASHDATADDQKGDLIFRTNDGSDGASPTEAMRITSQQRVGILTNDPSHALDVTQTGATSARVGGTGSSGANNGTIIINSGGTGDAMLRFDYETNTDRARIGTSTSGQQLEFYTGGSERMRVDLNGFIVGRTSFNSGLAGAQIEIDGDAYFTAEGGNGRALYANRLSSNGQILRLDKDGSQVASFSNTSSGALNILGNPSAASSLGFGTTSLLFPATDNNSDLGGTSFRFDDIFATNGTIQTSDEREKQQITSLTDAEITAAKAISKLFKTFKWNNSVEKKGDSARTHVGVIAQQVQTAMSDAGLDVTKYAFWCSDTWWETTEEVEAVDAVEAVDPVYDDDGVRISKGRLSEPAVAAHTKVEVYETEEEAPEGAVERTRLGVRYPELLAFISAATEQRLTSIEARLDALEAE